MKKDLEKNMPALLSSPLFQGIVESTVREMLSAVPYGIQSFAKDETVFHMMDEARQIGIVLEGGVQAQKAFPNGSQINVSVMNPGEIIGGAAAFSASCRYPCDIVAVKPSVVLMYRRGDLLTLLQGNAEALQNFLREIASATYMLQQRMELLSYNGIAQKAAFWLLMQARETGSDTIRIPGTVSKWAMMMNVSRPSLHRELGKLEKEGLIRYAPPVIQILNQDALQEVLSG